MWIEGVDARPYELDVERYAKKSLSEACDHTSFYSCFT